MLTAGCRVSTSGREPSFWRSRSTMASLTFKATKPEWTCSESLRDASTANVDSVVRCSSHGMVAAAS